MEIKDYYTTLGVEPSATLPEIKKSFRKLALQYHPDKTNNDPYADVRFSAIKEAYEVLSDPVKKEYYLQQRWYNQSIGKKKTQNPVTPVSILKQSLELERYVFQLNHYRMDKEGLKTHILGLISDEVIQQLLQFNETDISEKICSTILKTCNPLTLVQAREVCRQLQKLVSGNEHLSKDIDQFIHKYQKKKQAEKLTPVLIAILTIIICIIIFLAG